MYLDTIGHANHFIQVALPLIALSAVGWLVFVFGYSVEKNWQVHKFDAIYVVVMYMHVVGEGMGALKTI